MATAPWQRANRFGLLGMALPLLVLCYFGGLFATLFIAAVPLIAVWVGIPMLLGLVPAIRLHARLSRAWAGRMIGEPIPAPYQPVQGRGVYRRLRSYAMDPATWRDATWVLVDAVAGAILILIPFSSFVSGIFDFMQPALYPALNGTGFSWHGIPTDGDFALTFVYIPIGIVSLGMWWWVQRPLSYAHARMAKALLAPTESARLASRVREVEVSRAETVDAQAQELRRIERDLHDGAQARLVALGMSLGMAEEIVERNPDNARQLLAEAREASSKALAELRDLVRGIHPPVLADRGLSGAVRALALESPMVTDVEVDIGGRLPAPVESAAYFAVAETLTNVIKHAEATKVWISLKYDDQRLIIIVGDDGKGGADAGSGTGLRGIERRLSAFDGSLVVSSPIGGPTVVVMELPCEPLRAQPSTSDLNT